MMDVWPWAALLLSVSLFADDPVSDRLFYLRNWVGLVLFVTSLIGFWGMMT